MGADAALTIVAIAAAVAIMATAVFALFEVSPFARHRARFHAPGERQPSPRLD